jgi:hypothetical protein
VAHAEQTGISVSWKEAAPVMLKRACQWLSLVLSWLAAYFDSSKKLYPDRLAYQHELHPLAITDFDGKHLHIGEGDYGQVYAVKPTKKRRELGNIIKLGTTRCGKSSAELCQIVDFDVFLTAFEKMDLRAVYVSIRLFKAAYS